MVGVNWSNISDFGDLPAQANEVSGGSYWVSMYFMVWVILIFLFIGFGIEIALLSASFIMLVLGVLAVYAGLIAWPYLLIILSTILFTFLYIIWSSSKIRR